MTRHLVTSALPYINGTKHLGNLVGSMLPADVYARYLRQRGEEVLFLCATDEHGTPAELAAAEAGLEPRDFCDRQFEFTHALVKRWGLSFDHFGRSSSPQNVELTQHFALRLQEHGLIERRTTVQAFSITDDRFLPDRYVVGTCPHCAFDGARGDQCENCTRVLDPADLINPRSAISGSTQIEFRESTHLFLRQSELVDRLRTWIESHGDWPLLSRSIATKWLDEGLEDRGITRDLNWGVPVPDQWPDLAGKVFYVWFDAPIEYIAAAKEWADCDPSRRDWRSWWFSADDVDYTQFMAKDNVPFHTISFPATLLGSGEPWKLVDNLKSFNWLNYYGGKFSTSNKRGVFMHDALDVLPADAWRYVLMANAPEGTDAEFTWPMVAAALNKDLSGAFGNFVNRAMKFTATKFESRVPDGAAAGPRESALVERLEHQKRTLENHLDSREFRKAAQSLRAIWSTGNEYIDAAAPWKAIKDDRADAALSTKTSLGLIRLFAHLSAPIMPDTSRGLLRALGEPEVFAWPNDVTATVLGMESGREVHAPEILFPKFDAARVAELEAQFGGSSAATPSPATPSAAKHILTGLGQA